MRLNRSSIHRPQLFSNTFFWITFSSKEIIKMCVSYREDLIRRLCTDKRQFSCLLIRPKIIGMTRMFAF